MKKFIVLFREPDGRSVQHSEYDIKEHQQHWVEWFAAWGQKGNLSGGSGLTLKGRTIMGKGDVVTNDIHRNGTEIVGGYLLLTARDFDEAVEIMRSCPIYEFGGYSEIRELQNQN